MSGSLKKRWSLPESVIKHLFEGDPSDGSFSGFHSEAVKSFENRLMRISGQPPPEQWERRLNGDVYKLNVEIQINNAWVGPKVSTFFPHPAHMPHRARKRENRGDLFTKVNIIRWIEQALTRHTDNTRPSQTAWTEEPRKMARSDTGGVIDRIRVNGVSCHVLYTGGTIASVYPSALDEVDVTT